MITLFFIILINSFTAVMLADLIGIKSTPWKVLFGVVFAGAMIIIPKHLFGK